MEKGTYMSTSELVVAISVFILAGVMLIIGIMHFMEWGFLVNNSYLYASKEERASMNKKPYYRQSAVVFCLLCVVLIIIGLSVVLQNSMITLFEIPFVLAVIIYAIVSSARISKQEND